ncbi:transposase [Polaromonas sp. P1(28)-13]|nr:transposase [Polaromonas sp. P1(28)-13]
MASEARTRTPKRRFYSAELKLQVVGACARPGASIAGVALQHGINTNIVHRWLREHSQGTLVPQPQAFVQARPAGKIRVKTCHIAFFSKSTAWTRGFLALLWFTVLPLWTSYDTHGRACNLSRAT